MPRVHLTLEEGCAIIARARAACRCSPILPRSVPGRWWSNCWTGCGGVEVYHSDHTAAAAQRLLHLARSRGLLVTGGTDSHGPATERPTRIGEVAMPGWVEERFLAGAPEWWRDAWRRKERRNSVPREVSARLGTAEACSSTGCGTASRTSVTLR